MKREELVCIYAGANISGTLINSMIKGLTFALELGRSVGTAIKRMKKKTTC